jgi:hypothetical protein
MISKELYKSVLLDPYRKSQADTLYIVSGYGSATFARRHIMDLKEARPLGKVNLIIGMPGNRSDHAAFLALHKEFNGNFDGYYLNSVPPVHSKVYAWFSGNKPVVGYSGSANYSQFGFFEHQQVNQVADDSPSDIKDFYDNLLERSIWMPNMKLVLPAGHSAYSLEGSVPSGQILWEIPGKRVTISFLDKKGQLPAVSGLNWGQREEKRIDRATGIISTVRREPNQAYLSIKGDSRREGFLPETAYSFSLITDDGQSFDCVVAQEGRKAIQSTNDNSEIGRYFRKRLNIEDGAFVKKEHLEKYGRTDFTIEKIDSETFLLDFSFKGKEKQMVFMH